MVLGLVVGKAVGIFSTWFARFTKASLNPDLVWPDVFASPPRRHRLHRLALLIGELAFADDPALMDG